MWRIESDVSHPRLLHAACLADEFQRVINVRDGGVEAFLRRGPLLAIQTKGLVAEVVVRGTGEMAEVALKAEVGGFLAEMPFARHRGEVSGRCEHFGNVDGAAKTLIARLSAPATAEETDA